MIAIIKIRLMFHLHKYYMLRAFPENFFETDKYTDVRNNKCNQERDVNNVLNRMMTSECWSGLVC